MCCEAGGGARDGAEGEARGVGEARGGEEAKSRGGEEEEEEEEEPWRPEEQSRGPSKRKRAARGSV